MNLETAQPARFSFKKKPIFVFFSVVSVLIIVVLGVEGYFYWQLSKKSASDLGKTSVEGRALSSFNTTDLEQRIEKIPQLEEKAADEENTSNIDSFLAGLIAGENGINETTAIVLKVTDENNFLVEDKSGYTLKIKLAEGGEVSYIIDDLTFEGAEAGDLVKLRGVRKIDDGFEVDEIWVQPRSVRDHIILD